MPRIPTTKLASRSGKSGAQRHNPLPQQLQEDQLTSKFGLVSAPGRRNKRSKAQSASDEEEDQALYAAPAGMVTGGKSGGSNKDKKFIDPKLSRNILRLAREQQEELEREELQQQQPTSTSAIGARPDRDAPRGSASAMMPDDSDEDGEVNADDLGELDDDEAEMGQNGWSSYDANLEIDPSDRALLDKFEAEHGGEDGADDDDDDEDADMGGAAAGGGRGNKTLADLIMAKIEAAEASGASAAGANDADDRKMPPGINPKVIEVYAKVGELLSRYKSGPLPKAFKIVPSLPAWESILYITDPESWTPHATLAAVRIFVSTMKADQMQRFYELVLLDKVRDEIQDSGKVTYQTYEAIKKAIYKPAAFFKGFLFPLCESGTLTLKEAAIVSSVLAKVSIPVLHSAAALLRLAEMEYSGPTSLFIRVLLDKKYALPYKVVDSLVFHFLRFSEPNSGVELDKITRERRMPVLWHQSMLVFAQRYKQDLTPDQKAALLDLLRVQKHEGISPEVRRELLTATARGEMLEEPVDEDDDDMMSV